jgi:hypothetical protein
MSPGATRLRPAQEVSNETWIADATNGLLSMPSPLSFRERSLDAFKNGLMLIRLCGCGTVFTNLGSMLKRLFDRACQKDLAIWMVQRNLLSECEPAGVRIVGREHDFDLEIGSTQRSFRFVRIRDLEHREATVTEVLRERMTDEDVAFDQKDYSTSRQDRSVFLSLLPASSVNIAAVRRRS